MKHFIKLIAICSCLFLSGNVLAQKKLIKNRTRANLGTTMQVVKIDATQKQLKPYNKARHRKTTYKKNSLGIRIPVMKYGALPRKTIDIERIEEGPEWGWGWIHKKKTSARNIEGKDGRTNIHYFKNIRKGNFTSFSNDFDHIVVTDTLYAPTSFFNTDNKPRRVKRSYIKIIANCIIYESPIKLASTKLRTETDYVFSADSIFFKTKQNRLQKMKVGSSPPFVAADVNIKIHKDPFAEKEKILVNRLFIEIMKQINRELISERNVWEKDKLLIEFQKYRYRVREDVLWKDPEYDKYFAGFDDFDSNQENAIERERTVNDMKVLVEGKVSDLDKSPFKYYVIPSKATLTPVMDEESGVLNKLGNLIYRATGDSKLTVSMGVKLGYQKELLEKTNVELNKYGFTLEKGIPKKTLLIDEQPLQIRGSKEGRIIPIDSDILELKFELQDEGLSIIKLLAKPNDVTFDLIFKAYDSRHEFRQKVLFKISDDIIEQIDFNDKMTSEFNIIETNSIDDLVTITSNLKSDLGGEFEGILNYIEVSLEIQFDNEKVSFWGPYKMSSASVLGSKKSVHFIKHSEDYSIKVSGKAYYENGIREIKDNLIITSPFIELQEDLFKDNSLKN